MIPTLQVIASSGLGGAESAFQRASEALTAAGHPVTCLIRRNAKLEGVLSPQQPQIQLPLRNYIDVASMWRLRSLLKSGDWPIVQTWMQRATWLTHAPRGVLHVARLGGYYRPRYFRHAHAWVVNTKGLYDWMLQQGFPRERLEWVKNFVPELPADTPRPLSRAGLGVPEDALLVVALGRMIEKKGFQDLIAAALRLPAEIGGRPLHFLLMGDGPLRPQLEQQAAPMAGRVHFSGWVNNALAALPIGDAFVCPSRDEPLGNVILEAWAQRMPVLSTTSAGGIELIEEGVSGLLVPIAEAAPMADALRRLLDDAALRKTLAETGHRMFRASHSAESTVAAYLDFYQRMLRLQRPGG